MDVLLELVPELEDILDFQPPNQMVLIKPLKVGVIKSKQGLILSGTGPDGDGGSIDLDKTRSAMPQQGVVISCGKRVEEYKAGMTVFYYKSALTDIMLRQGDELYYGIQEYNLKGFLKA